MTPKPTEWWLRPVIAAARVGEQSEVEKMRLKRSPSSASASIAGVGMTPPKVLGTAKPASSVMIIRMSGASFGGTTRGGHQGVDCSASSLITPPKAGAGGGSWLPGIVVVAAGEPSTPVTTWALVPAGTTPMRRMELNRMEWTRMVSPSGGSGGRRDGLDGSGRSRRSGSRCRRAGRARREETR